MVYRAHIWFSARLSFGEVAGLFTWNSSVAFGRVGQKPGPDMLL